MSVESNGSLLYHYSVCLWDRWKTLKFVFMASLDHCLSLLQGELHYHYLQQRWVLPVLVLDIMVLPGGTSGREPSCQCWRHERWGFHPWVRKMPWRRAWHPTPVFLPGESHAQNDLEGSVHVSHRVRHDWSDLALLLLSCSVMSDSLRPHGLQWDSFKLLLVILFIYCHCCIVFCCEKNHSLSTFFLLGIWGSFPVWDC